MADERNKEIDTRRVQHTAEHEFTEAIVDPGGTRHTGTIGGGGAGDERKYDVVVYKDGSETVATERDGTELARGTDSGSVISSVVDVEDRSTLIHGSYTLESEIAWSRNNVHIDAESAEFTVTNDSFGFHPTKGHWSELRIGRIHVASDGRCGVLSEGTMSLDLKVTFGDLNGGTFTYDDGTGNGSGTYDRCGVMLKGMTGDQGTYYNHVKADRDYDVHDGKGIVLTTTAGQSESKANGNEIWPLHLTNLTVGVDIQHGHGNTIYSPEISACGTGIKMDDAAGNCIVGFGWFEDCTKGIELTSGARASWYGEGSFSSVPVDDRIVTPAGARFAWYGPEFFETTGAEYGNNDADVFMTKGDLDEYHWDGTPHFNGFYNKTIQPRPFQSERDNLIAHAANRFTTSYSEPNDGGSTASLYNGYMGWSCHWEDANTTYPLTITISDLGEPAVFNGAWCVFYQQRGPDDGLTVETSSDNGSTWNTLASTTESIDRRLWVQINETNRQSGVDQVRYTFNSGDSGSGRLHFGELGIIGTRMGPSDYGYLLAKEGDSMYGNLNMDGNQVTNVDQGSVSVKSSAPSSPSSGDWYVDDGTNTSSGNLGIRIYDGTAWVDQN